jgi:hypothetical protein
MTNLDVPEGDLTSIFAPRKSRKFDNFAYFCRKEQKLKNKKRQFVPIPVFVASLFIAMITVRKDLTSRHCRSIVDRRKTADSVEKSLHQYRKYWLAAVTIRRAN